MCLTLHQACSAARCSREQLHAASSARSFVDSIARSLQQRNVLISAGIAVAVYGLVGVFGAARYGLATQGDLLVNSWLHGRAEGVLDAVLVAYLAISIPPIQVHCVPPVTVSWGLARSTIS